MVFASLTVDLAVAGICIGPVVCLTGRRHGACGHTVEVLEAVC